MLFIEYPKCSTCVRAKKFLAENSATFSERDIKSNNPTADELKDWHQKSGLPISRLFNSSGLLYRSLELSKKLPLMSDDEKYDLLATDGMLVKRPILVTENSAYFGFKEADYQKALSK